MDAPAARVIVGNQTRIHGQTLGNILWHFGSRCWCIAFLCLVVGERPSEWVVIAVTVIRIDGGGDYYVINSYSPRLALPQQMLVHRLFVPGGWVSNRVSG